METEIKPKHSGEKIADPEEEEVNAKGLLTTSETARALNVHINTIRRWSNIGVLKCFRVGPRSDRRFLKNDVEKFLRE